MGVNNSRPQTCNKLFLADHSFLSQLEEAQAPIGA